MELLVRIVNSWKSLIFFARTTIFGVFQGSEYTCDIHEKKFHNNTFFGTPSGHLLLSLPDVIFLVNSFPRFILILLELFNQCQRTIPWILFPLTHECNIPINKGDKSGNILYLSVKHALYFNLREIGNICNICNWNL